jgi:hypothetical protein
MLSGMAVGRQVGPFSCAKQQISEPIYEATMQETNITVKGNGVWETYFEPVSSFSLDNPCSAKDPYVTFNEQDITMMHYRWPQAVRVWQYMKCSLPKPGRGQLHEWYGIMRQRSFDIVKRYFRPKPWLQQLINRANPSAKCMAMHVRLTDKSGANRALIGIDAYQPYAIAYAEIVGGSIYLASDSSTPLRNVTHSWPKHVVERIITQPNVLQSSDMTAVFDLGAHHRTNTEILTDVYAMAKCNVFLHGHSGVSESTIYVNPNLHNCSVDLEDPNKPTVKQFKEMLVKRGCGK